MSNPIDSPEAELNENGDAERDFLAQLLKTMLGNLPEHHAELVRLGAIPRWLDQETAAFLYDLMVEDARQEQPRELPEEQPRELPKGRDAAFDVIRKFRFVTTIAPAQFVYQSQMRAALLAEWRADDQTLARFRQHSARLADYYLQRSHLAGELPQTLLPEWIYHLFVANPQEAITQLGRLFERAIEARELGFAERLANTATLQQQWGDGINAWIDYYRGRLALARDDYETANTLLLGLLKSDDATLVATVERALGLLRLCQKQWSESIWRLRISVDGFKRLKDIDNLVWSQIALGDAIRDLAEKSGGIYQERVDFANGLHILLYTVLNLPFIVYRRLADRIDFLPTLFGLNFQNWIVVRILWLARRAYQAAQRQTSKIDDERLLVEIEQRLADTNLELGVYGRAGRLYRTLLTQPLVQTSAFRSARARFGLAAIAIQRNKLTTADGSQTDGSQTGTSPSSIRDDLLSCLEIFLEFGERRRAADSAQLLAQLAERQGQLSEAIGFYGDAIEIATQRQDVLQRTEAVIALRRLLLMDERAAQQRRRSTPRLLDEDQRAWVESLIDGVDSLAYLERFPGKIRQQFNWLAWGVAGPTQFLLALVLAFLLTLTISIVAGELAVWTSRNAAPLPFINLVALMSYALSPFILLWGLKGLYAAIGLLLIHFLLPITRIEHAQPDLYILDREKIVLDNGMGQDRIHMQWHEITAIIFADRCYWRIPGAIMSRTLLTTGERVMVIRGATNHYEDLQRATAEYLDRREAGPPAKYHLGMSLINHWSSWATLLLAAVLAYTFVSLTPDTDWIAYCGTNLVNGECPNLIPLVFAAIVSFTMFFFVPLFTVALVARLIYAEYRVRKALRQAKHDAEATLPPLSHV